MRFEAEAISEGSNEPTLVAFGERAEHVEPEVRGRSPSLKAAGDNRRIEPAGHFDARPFDDLGEGGEAAVDPASQPGCGFAGIGGDRGGEVYRTPQRSRSPGVEIGQVAGLGDPDPDQRTGRGRIDGVAQQTAHHVPVDLDRRRGAFQQPVGEFGGDDLDTFVPPGRAFMGAGRVPQDLADLASRRPEHPDVPPPVPPDQGACAVGVVAVRRDRGSIPVEGIEQVAEDEQMLAGGMVDRQGPRPLRAEPRLLHDLDRDKPSGLGFSHKAFGESKVAGVGPGEMQKMPHLRRP